MPRPSSLTPTKISKDKWRLNVPKSLSPTGSRQRLFFESKKAADIEVERLKGMAKRWGTEGRSISATLSEDATKASALLEGYDYTLYTAMREWRAWKDAQAASITFENLFKEYKSEKISEGISDIYARDIDKFAKPFIAELGGKIVSEILHTEVKDILKEFPSTRQRANAYRTIRPIFSMALDEGYTTENIFDRIKTPKHSNRKTEVLSVPELKKLFNACSDYKEREDLIRDYRVDATDTAHAFALMVFAGIRPEEIKRLQWESIHMEEGEIIIDGEVSKTRSHRIIPIEDNLVDWLEQVPVDERTGSVVPSNWGKKYQIVRKVSGVGDRQQDILRHTFASAHLGAYNDFNATQSAMGHGTAEMILKHYRTLIRKQDAVKYWNLRPKSTDVKLKAVGA